MMPRTFVVYPFVRIYSFRYAILSSFGVYYSHSMDERQGELCGTIPYFKRRYARSLPRDFSELTLHHINNIPLSKSSSDISIPFSTQKIRKSCFQVRSSLSFAPIA